MTVLLQKQFVNHFSGCQMCLDLNVHGDMPECEREYIKSFEYANSVMMKVLARKPPRNLTMHDAILASFYCQVISSLHDLPPPNPIPPRPTPPASLSLCIISGEDVNKVSPGRPLCNYKSGLVEWEPPLGLTHVKDDLVIKFTLFEISSYRQTCLPSVLSSSFDVSLP